MSQNLKSLLMLLGLVLLIVGFYVVLVKFDIMDSLQVNPAIVEEQTANLEREVLDQLEKIKSITFDSSLFERDDFTSLKDLSVELPAPRVARPNPFAELLQ